ncbi:hypothetical protein AWM68_17465 [Fictibacillus phosphorivorans]|uniref:Uncharacterized protein n=1 Tax=Fictibacillus phosphorivorans TaxID=1221500 RepID=A0A161TPL2_9BACL|nr:hypothetical protein [Fictibacillus phosphorivorans]KZE67961.1 hypothetical protein AWM68_17465 [Fictibacillus phosphorivorans]
MNENLSKEQESTIRSEIVRLVYKKSKGISILEKIRLFINLSYLMTGPCLLFMFLAPKETTPIFVFFALITGSGHFISYIQRIEIKCIKEDLDTLKIELKRIMELNEKSKLSELNQNILDVIMKKPIENDEYKSIIEYVDNKLS